MESTKIRQTFLDFFEEKGHRLVSSSSLIPDDPSVLLTTAGMQQFKKYFLGEVSPFGQRVASVQKCFRTSDLEKVGDGSHLTFLEMLGNFSFGDYFKAESAAWALELLTDRYGLPLERLFFTYFGGEAGLPSDQEIKDIWLGLGIKEEAIFPLGREDNFWGPTGSSGPCGPTTEIYYDITGKNCDRASDCCPGCGCGRFIEIWNLVFNQYYQDENGSLSGLPLKGIDTGMGLERLALAVQETDSIFETDLFRPLIENLVEFEVYLSRPAPFRIIADHLRGLVFLTSEGVAPSNSDRGYVVRRIVRRLIEVSGEVGLGEEVIGSALNWIEDNYVSVYPELRGSALKSREVISAERLRLERAVKKGLSRIETDGSGHKLSGQEAFHLYATYGLSPAELQRQGYVFDEQELKKAIEEHKNISRRGAENKFGGHGIGEADSEFERQEKTKLHTATHLLHSALIHILGDEIKQRGSDINSERLRFDFSFSRGLTPDEISRVSDRVNEMIAQGLVVDKTEMSIDEARTAGAVMVDGQAYPERVDVYAIINGDGAVLSREVCGGPHVINTRALGTFKIIKEQSSSAGVRRIKAILKHD